MKILLLFLLLFENFKRENNVFGELSFQQKARIMQNYLE